MAESLTLLKDTQKALHDMIRELSRKRFEDISARNGLILEDQVKPDDFIYGSHLTVIQIASKDLRITFKSHFTLGDVRRLTDRGKERTQEQVLRSTYDLFKEYSNLVAGGISQQLNACGIVAGISLPLATSGFDEVIASDEVRPTRQYDFWRVRGQEFSFICSVYAEIFEIARLSQFSFQESSLGADEGEVELL